MTGREVLHSSQKAYYSGDGLILHSQAGQRGEAYGDEGEKSHCAR
jgi:hypothetical protein